MDSSRDDWSRSSKALYSRYWKEFSKKFRGFFEKIRQDKDSQIMEWLWKPFHYFYILLSISQKYGIIFYVCNAQQEICHRK